MLQPYPLFVERVKVGDETYRISTAIRGSKSETLVFEMDWAQVLGASLANVDPQTALMYHAFLSAKMAAGKKQDVFNAADEAYALLEKWEAANKIADTAGLTDETASIDQLVKRYQVNQEAVRGIDVLTKEITSCLPQNMLAMYHASRGLTNPVGFFNMALVASRVRQGAAQLYM